MGAIPFALWAFSCLLLVQISSFKITSALVTNTTNITTNTTTQTNTTTPTTTTTTTRLSLAAGQSPNQNWFGPSVVMSLGQDNIPPSTSEPSLDSEQDSLLESKADNQVDPMETDMCIWNQDLAWRYGHSWQVAPCNQTCRCAFRLEPKDPSRDAYMYVTKNLRPNSFQTEIRCGLAPAYCDSQTQLEPEAYRLKSFLVNPVNSSTLEIKLVLPDFALGQSGRIELNYTSVPPNVAEFQTDEPPANATWLSRTKIRTLDGIFSKRLIVHFLSDLRPNHKYWLKTLVRFEGEPFATPIESPLQSVVMPQPMVKLLPNKVRVLTWTTQRPTTTATSIEPALAPTSATTTATTTTTTASTTTQTAASSTSGTTSTTQTPDSTTSTYLITPAPVSTSITDTISTTTTASITTKTKPITTTKPQLEIQGNIQLVGDATNIRKPDVSKILLDEEPCKNGTDNNGLRLASRFADPIEDTLRALMNEWIQNAPVERYAWHLLVALVAMTILFLIVSYLYCKKSRVIAPITSPHYPYHHGHHYHHHNQQQQSAYDNPTFTKLLSFYQPHVLLVNESNQNFDNQAKQKNIEVDELSPLSNQIMKGHEKRSNNREETKN